MLRVKERDFGEGNNAGAWEASSASVCGRRNRYNSLQLKLSNDDCELASLLR